MLCNLNEWKGGFSPLDEDKIVVGFYCPKGFFFVKVDRPSTTIDDQCCDFGATANSLENHALNLSMDDVIQITVHDSPYKSVCHYQPPDLSTAPCGCPYGFEWFLCVCHRVQRFCSKICERSKWVQKLIKKLEKVYESIVSSYLHREFYKTLEEKMFIQVAKGKHATSFSRLDSIMKLEDELKSWLSQLTNSERFELENDTDVAEIINNDKFWDDGNELLEALTPLLQIPRLMDTLVPTAGCLKLATDKAKHALKTYYDRNRMKFIEIWFCLLDWIRCIDLDYPLQEITTYLNPVYISSKEVQWNLNLSAYEVDDLKCFVGVGEKETIDAELKDYSIQSSNPFANISISECQANHPISLWCKYGGGCPLLQKCAIKILSQPSSCLCHQVKKHLSQLQGSDNYILRLNAKMMEEFAKYGDNIYQPIDFEQSFLAST